jgi:K(+)-stimulated pyrophosphate-energized sodium pump
LIGLVVAPILGDGHSASAMTEKGSCCKMEMHAGGLSSKCDMSKMAAMTKEECAQMCKEKGCTAEETAKCLANYDANGKYLHKKTDCFDTSKYQEKSVRIEMKMKDGKTVGTVTKSENGKATTETFEGTEAEVKAKIEAAK